LIQLDCEGDERGVLLGAKQTINTHRPLIVLGGASDFLEVMRELDYAEVGSCGFNDDVAFAPAEWNRFHSCARHRRQSCMSCGYLRPNS